MRIESIEGKIAVITGGSRGIGHATAQILHENGAKVVITGRNQESLIKAAKEIGKNCFPIQCDHSNPESIQKFAEAFHRDFNSADILINNAGCMKSQPVLGMSLELWNQVIATNLTGVFLTTKAFLPGMIDKNRGDIIMISSMSGKKGDPGSSAYAASKFGLQGFSQSLLYEVRQHNIRVMVINPSRVDKSSGTDRLHGKGLTLHANDIAYMILHLLTLPGRTLIRDMDIWGTNP